MADYHMTEKVLAIISGYLRKGVSPRYSDRLIEDLRIGSDDSTAMAAEIERMFRLSIPDREWRQVHTVADVVRLVEKFLEMR